MSSYGEKYNHLVGKHVDEAIETLKNDGMFYMKKGFFLYI